MMVGDESVRRSAVDGRSRMSLVGQAPPCRKPDRRDQARFEALNRAGSGWEIVRETLKRPWSTGSDSLSRSRPTSPSWSATRSATCGRHSTRLPISWPCALWSAHRGCRANDGVTDPHFRRAVRRLGDLKNKQTKLRRSEIFGERDSGRFGRAEVISGRSREDAVGRSQEAEGDNDVGFVLNRLRNVYKHRRLPLLAATLAREGGR